MEKYGVCVNFWFSSAVSTTVYPLRGGAIIGTPDNFGWLSNIKQY